jgi:hypothetical protein
VIDQFASGVPAQALAQRCGVTVDVIVRQAKLAGVKAGLIDVEQADQIVAFYRQGASVARVGRELGLGWRLVRQVIASAGVDVHGRGW